jgi:hypothetical protein
MLTMGLVDIEMDCNTPVVPSTGGLAVQLSKYSAWQLSSFSHMA